MEVSARSRENKPLSLFAFLPLLSSLFLQQGESVVIIDPSSPSFEYVGRWNFVNKSAPTFQWAGSSITFGLQCTDASVISAMFETHEYTKFGVYIDTKNATQQKLSNSVTPKSADKPLLLSIDVPSDSPLTLTIVKTTEDFVPDPAFNFVQGSKTMLQNPSKFLGVKTDSSICTVVQSPMPRKIRRMQIIGDSITCGYGNQLKPGDTKLKSCTPVGDNFYKMEDTHESYSMRLARKFDAEVHIQCISGIGMCKNANEPATTHSPNNMTYFIDRVLPYSPAETSNLWDYSQYVPDLLLINLGTNDYDTSVGPVAPKEAEFIAAYVNFVKHITKNYAHTKVVLACGPMTDRFCGSVQKVVIELQADSNMQVAFASQAIKGSPSSLHGCANHPDQDEDIEMVKLLVPVVQNLTGWAPVGTK